MTPIEESESGLNRLVGVLETIEIDRLKHVSYKKYVNQLVDVCKQSISIDGTRLMIIIQRVKSYKTPCFQRDVIIDVLAKIVSDGLLLNILKEPFTKRSSTQWSELACAIATLPDLVANCKSLEKYPQLAKDPYYNKLIDQVYESIECRSKTEGENSGAQYKFFLIKLLGRVTIAGFSHIVWSKFTQRAIRESRGHVRQFCSDILRITLKPPAELTSLELFIDHLCLPIFSNLKPNPDSGQLIKSMLGTSLEDSDHLRYLICDKSIFKTNHHLARDKQAIILFNIAAYMSSLVIPCQDKHCDINMEEADGNVSLLTRTLLEIVRSWTNPTKILVRTYQHNKYISCALLIFFRYASHYDSKNLANHANNIQSMIINSIPIYLNRASEKQRNIACCLCELILPKLRDLMTSKQAKSCENGELKLNFTVDLDDDLLYLQQLFNHDVEVLFRDVSDTIIEAKATVTTSIKLSGPSSAGSIDHDVNNDQVNSCQLNYKQLQEKTNNLSIDENDKTSACRSSSSKSVMVDLINRDCASKAPKARMDHDEDDDDLIPYSVSEEEGDDDSDGGEFDPGSDAINVPIYLRDCINGLIENNNHRYVRLCLIKASALIDEMIEQVDSNGKKSDSVCLAVGQKKSPNLFPTITGDCLDGWEPSRHDGVNDTIKDVGVELARTLLFIDNQFNIDKFDEYRISCLVSLCFAAPSLIGKYLVDELNGSNRSMRQQLDILHVLIASAHRLAFNTKLNSSDIHQLTTGNEQLVVSSKYRNTKKSVNKFTPYASLFFYGISYRLKADFVDARSLIITQPQSIMSAFRERHIKDDSVFKIDANESGIIFKTAQQLTGREQRNCRLILSDNEDNDNYENNANKTNKSLERDSISDDSYLLSRILLSISNILSCSAQQPVTCKLSSDLLDILSAYRCHPDSGVQRALVGCLKMIRDCTPSTYYSEYIEKRMLRSFGPWLAKNESNIQR